MAHLAYPDFDCTVTYDNAVPCVVMTWKGYATSRLFRDSTDQVMDALITRKATKLLGDVKDFVLIGAEDQDWLSTTWIPQAIALGLRTVALVKPTFHFNRVAIESVADRLDPARLTLRHFDNLDEARAWLMTVE